MRTLELMVTMSGLLTLAGHQLPTNPLPHSAGDSVFYTLLNVLLEMHHQHC